MICWASFFIKSINCPGVMKNVFDDGDVTSITSFATDGLKPKIFNKHDVTQWLHCIVGNLGARFWKRKNA